MALQQYSLSWSDQLIARVETHLRDLHSLLGEYYAEHGYAMEVEGCRGATDVAAVAATTPETEEGSMVASGAAVAPLDAISPAGSFLLRTCVYDTPFPDLHAQRGVGADLVLSIPIECCTATDLQEGRYLEQRHAFLQKIQAHLLEVAREAARLLPATSSSAPLGEDSEDAAVSASPRRQQSDRKAQPPTPDKATTMSEAVAERLSRLEVRAVPVHNCPALAEKEILQLRFRRRRCAESYETFFVNLHFRPSVFSGRTVNAAAVRRHPYCSYCLLEDYLMPHYLKKLHAVCVAHATIRRAIVVLKCWAHHQGLMTTTSAHPEGLNGFIVSAMVVRLWEEGIVTGGMSLDNIVRSVWVQLTRGFFLSTPDSATSITARPARVSAAEEQGEMGVLRFAGEVHNILFRTSVSFLKNVVCSAAEEALQHPFAIDVVDRVAFQVLPLRFDVALSVQLTPVDTFGKEVSVVDRSAAALRQNGRWRAPRVEAAEKSAEILREAFGVRSRFITAWQVEADRLQIVVQLTSEAEGRERLTRGPPIEDAAAVERFNTFWGREITSTRQFSDGAIYRCVLWTFPEDQGTHTTVALSASTVLRRVAEFALRKHVAPKAAVSVLLGGLEGVLAERVGGEWRDAATLMQRNLLEATKAVQFLFQNLPRGSVPCRIVSFDVIAASERHTEVFPVRPHLALTYTTDDLTDANFVGLSTAPTVEPIHCVLSIDDNHKIPDTMEAIAMMKGAIAAQLATTLQVQYGEKSADEDGSAASNGRKPLHKKKKASGNADGGGGDGRAVVQSPIRTQCTNQSVDIIYRGYLFRVYVAHYREVSLLRALQREAEANVLEMKLHWTALHAKFMRTIAFGHHSFSHAVRIAKRWISAMLLYEFVPPEAVELLVAYAYLEAGPSTPKTPAGGFLRFVQLLATHDWSTPLVLPFTDDLQDKAAVAAAELLRKPGDHQGMFIATPYAPAASPFTVLTPRPMIMARLVQLAQSVVAVLLRHIENGNTTAGEVEAFTSNPDAFDFSMKFHPRLILQPDRTLGIRKIAAEAPASPTSEAEEALTADTAASTVLRIWQLDELDAATSGREYIHQLVEREPAAHAVRIVRAALRERGMMFYDALAPSVLHVVGISAERQIAKSQQLHNAILQMGRGAFLPASAHDFLPGVSARTGRTSGLKSLGSHTAETRTKTSKQPPRTPRSAPKEQASQKQQRQKGYASTKAISKAKDGSQAHPAAAQRVDRKRSRGEAFKEAQAATMTTQKAVAKGDRKARPAGPPISGKKASK